MKSDTKKRARGIVCLAILWISVPGISLAQGGYDEIFFFGDSLSDPGNAYQLSGETSKAPYLLIPEPNAPYAIGGHHFSNGKTWAERFAQNLNAADGGRSAVAKPGKNGNYAFAGARARFGSGSPAPDRIAQVGMFLGDHPAAPSGALYVIQYGGNDVRDALVAAATGTGDPVTMTLDAVAGVVAAISDLYGAGARNFLVANSPSIEHAPAVKLGGPAAVGGAIIFTGLFNGVLEGNLQGLELTKPDINIVRLDLAGFINDVVADPAAFGITNADWPCLTFFTASDAKCGNPEEHLFWDGIHPTAVIHDQLGDVATAVISGS